MSPSPSSILEQLEIVRLERDRRDADPKLGLKVELVKRFQQARFTETYADLLRDPQYADACRFFLDDLYGPGDQSVRDAQFARVVPTLCRLFPADVAATVEALARLHAVSEQLDTEMANHVVVVGPSVTSAAYSLAWNRTGRPDSRRLQLELLLAVGRSLQLYTQRPMMRQALRTMRVPAKVAGLAQLQRFLERGFIIFGSMATPQKFLACIAEREQQYAERQFAR